MEIYNYIGWVAESLFKEIQPPFCSQGAEMAQVWKLMWDCGFKKIVTIIVIQVRFPFIRYRAV